MSHEIEVVLVDAGNTSIKTAEVVQGRIVHEKRWSRLTEVDQHYRPGVPFCVCSTGTNELHFKRESLIVTHHAPLGLSLSYETPETLGADRIAAAVGCYELFPAQNSLLVDLGTCMTMDFVSKEGVFEGGVISPGLKMRMSAMASSTANLPDISDEWKNFESKFLGKSTKECLKSGSYFGMVHEINGLKSRLEAEFTSLNVILSGGDAHHFESKVKAYIFAGSKIVLTGLYRIWKNQ